MTHNLVLLADRLVGMVVAQGALLEPLWAATLGIGFFGKIARLLTALVDEELGKVHVSLVADDAGELHEREFDLLVAAVARHLAGAEALDHVVGRAAHDIQELALAGSLVVGDGRFDRLACAVEFLEVAQVAPFPLGLDALEDGVEVAVGFRSRSYMSMMASAWASRSGLGLR